MTRTARALAFPRAYSIMVGELTGKVVDVLRVLASTKTFRASAADVTRRLILKGMAVEAAEHALTYVAGRPVELTTGLLADVHAAMGEEFGKSLPGNEPDTVLQAVLSRMWPEVVAHCEKLDTRTPLGKKRLSKVLAGPPLTREGRPLTSKDIRAQALADIVSGRAQAPKLIPPRNVQEAREQARLQTEADRLAVDRGVSVDTLLAGTAGGQAIGMVELDESAGAAGWSESKQGTGSSRRPRPEPVPEAEPEAAPQSLGAMLKQARGQ